MIRHAFYWSRRFRDEFVPEIQAIANALENRILPRFAALAKEADRFVRKCYARASESAEENKAEYHVADAAKEIGSAHYSTMKQVVQGILNLFTVTYFHATAARGRTTRPDYWPQPARAAAW